METTNQVNKEEVMAFIESKCEVCGFRVGSHGIRESFACGLMTQNDEAPYNKKKLSYNETTQKYEYSNDTSLRSELIDMFGDEVYFRDSKIVNGITERFKNTRNTICFVCCEGGTEKHLDYYSNYWGSADLRALKKKYDVCYEWEDNCVASFHYESVADNEN